MDGGRGRVVGCGRGRVDHEGACTGRPSQVESCSKGRLAGSTGGGRPDWPAPQPEAVCSSSGSKKRVQHNYNKNTKKYVSAHKGDNVNKLTWMAKTNRLL